MKDSQILSTFMDELVARPERPRILVFDACHVGVIMRAVLFVEATMMTGAMYGAVDFMDWLLRMSILTGAALPATLAWLIVACSLKSQLERLTPRAQAAFGVLMGAIAGLYGCGLLRMTGMTASAPWLASALTGAMLAALLVVALFLRAKGRTPAATAARLSELQARIRPHFLFNTFNSAIALVRQDPARAETLLEDLSDLFRHALSEQSESVTLTEEVALARRYLGIEQVRFGERLRVEWALDPNAGQAKVPPLMLQPLVENAVKHGVEPSASGAQVRISTQRRGSIVVIKVTNTVPAGQGQRGQGVAQANVRDRLRLLHDVQGQFQTALVDGVYQVRIEVPA
jgi:two-component system sensor histidine kinase AlgZ